MQRCDRPWGKQQSQPKPISDMADDGNHGYEEGGVGNSNANCVSEEEVQREVSLAPVVPAWAADAKMASISKYIRDQGGSSSLFNVSVMCQIREGSVAPKCASVCVSPSHLLVFIASSSHHRSYLRRIFVSSSHLRRIFVASL